MFRSKNSNQKQQERRQQHKKPGSIHVVFGATCSRSMDWKSIGVFHSFYTSGWKTKITRLMACRKEKLQSYRGMDIGPTFVFTDQQSIEGYGDSPTYNKPAGIMHFTQEVKIEEEFILFIDADMLLRRVIDMKEDTSESDPFHSYAKVAKKGVVMTEWVWYIQEGIQNGLAKQFLTDDDAIKRASNTHGGYYHLFHVDDAREVAPRWLHYTKEVRQHPERYWSKLPGSNLERDIDTVQKGLEFGGVPWISEMYGYAFAAAEIGLEHKFTRGGGGVLYGDDFLTLNHDGPFLSHYTLSCHVPSIETYTKHHNNHNDEDFMFNKEDFRNFDPLDCHDGFLFPKPDIRLVDEGAALCAENVERLNFALCHFYKNKCLRHTKAYQRAMSHCPWDTDSFNLHHSKVKPSDCGNRLSYKDCQEEVKNGQCLHNPAYMQLSCLEACGFCATDQPNSTSNREQLKVNDHQCQDLAGAQVCSELAHDMLCILNPTYMVVNCRKTCGKCPSNGDSQELQAPQKFPLGVEESSDGDETLFILTIFALIALLFGIQKIFWRRLSPRGQTKKST